MLEPAKWKVGDIVPDPFMMKEWGWKKTSKSNIHYIFYQRDDIILKTAKETKKVIRVYGLPEETSQENILEEPVAK